MHTMLRPLTAALALAGAGALAQPPLCSSDGQPAPAGVLERFINADCEGCWTDVRAPEPQPRELALDWIVPGSRGDDAPLSPAARPDALERLDALARRAPRHEDALHTRRRGPGVALRIAHGLVFNGYLGVSIELPRPPAGRWRAWLALVETIPAGSERTPVERNLVRNVLQLSWRAGGGESLSELRAMNIPEGAHAGRLRLVALLEDARGRVRAIAQTRCVASGHAR